MEDMNTINFPNPKETGRLPIVLEAARKLRREVGDDIPLVGTFEGTFTNTCRIIEVGRILRMTHKNPLILDELLERMNSFLIDFAQALIKNGVTVLFIPEHDPTPEGML